MPYPNPNPTAIDRILQHNIAGNTSVWSVHWFYRVIPLELTADGIPHTVFMVDSIKPYVVIVNLQQSIFFHRVVQDGIVWNATSSFCLKE